ncbi:MAG: NADPH-dependent FMN reductase [Candidatus Bathyarchaeia archaeon]
MKNSRMGSIRVVGLGGSLSKISTSLAALKLALQGASDAGAQTTLLDIRSLDLPIYAPDLDPPTRVVQMCNEVHHANGLIWSSPMYHGTISGSFKNAIDWLQLLGERDPPYLKDKIVGMISTAGGVQGLQAVNTMEFIVRALRGWAVPLVIPVARATQAFDKAGRVTDRAIEDQLRSLGREVVRASEQFNSHGYCDYSPETTADSTQ